MAKRPGDPGAKAEAADEPSSGAATEATKDVALILDKTEDQKGFHVVRRRSEDLPLEFGTVRPLEEGKAIDGEVVSLRPRKEAPFVCDVKTELPARRLTDGGPAQVATEQYRRGWEAIWGAAATPPGRLN